MGKSVLELAFKAEWKRLGGEQLLEEVQFHQTRRWRFDFVHEASKTVIEIDGGSKGFFKKDKYGLSRWVSGRHQSADGYQSDCDKLNEATLMGYKVFRLTGKMSADSQLIKRIIEFSRSQN